MRSRVLRLHKRSTHCGVHRGRGISCGCFCAVCMRDDVHFLLFLTRVNLVSADRRCKGLEGKCERAASKQPCCSTTIGPNRIIQFSACATTLKADFLHKKGNHHRKIISDFYTIKNICYHISQCSKVIIKSCINMWIEDDDK